MRGRPNTLFPVGIEGGKMRNAIEAANNYGEIEVEAPIFICTKCGNKTVYPFCEKCGSETVLMRVCPKCGKLTTNEKCPRCGRKTKIVTRRKINIKYYLDLAIKNLKISKPALVKGVRGMTSAKKIPERLEKGILRAIHNLPVNKDGTIRIDMTELPLTHFKPKEIGVSVEKLRELGYTHDIYGNPLERDDQILELKPQDVIIPDCDDWKEAKIADWLVKIANFVDDELERVYGMKRFYNIKRKEDLIGHFVFVIAPHTSTATVGRIIGFTKAQAIFMHPIMHAAERRNCLPPNEKVIIKDKEGIKVKTIYEVIKKYKPEDIEILHFYNGKLVWKRPIDYVRNKSPKELIRIYTKYGREITVTPYHKFLVYDEKKKKFIVKRADQLEIGDRLPIINKIPIENEITEIFTYKYFTNKKNYRAHGLKEIILEKIKEYNISLRKLCDDLNISPSQIYKDSIPMNILTKLAKILKIDLNKIKFFISYRKKFISIPSKIKLTKDLGFLVGLYLADGHARRNSKLNQISISNSNRRVIEYIKKIFEKEFDYSPRVEKRNNVYVLTASGRVIYDFFINILKLGRNAKEKRIPWYAYNNKEFAIGIISGLIEGDGCIDRDISITTINKDLVNDIATLLTFLDIFASITKEKRKYKGKDYEEYKIRIYSIDTIKKLCDLGLVVIDKLKKIKELSRKEGNKPLCFGDTILAKIVKIEKVPCKSKYVYDFIIEGNKTFVAGFGNLVTIDCDGDEIGIILALDALLNFSREFLPASRGGFMDAPIVLTVNVELVGIDSEAYNTDIVDKYPLELYEKSQEYVDPKEVKIERIEDRIGKENEFYGYFFTIDTDDINIGNKVSSYKRLATMTEKVLKQMELAEKIIAVDENKVATIVIEKHFLKDIMGNLRKIGIQTFRCVNCNEKYRRYPLTGKCWKCGGRVVQTVSEGFVKKYLGHTLTLADKYQVPDYLAQWVKVIKDKIESVFGTKEEISKGLEFFLNNKKKAKS